jgi:hypothetical protein
MAWDLAVNGIQSGQFVAAWRIGFAPGADKKKGGIVERQKRALCVVFVLALGSLACGGGSSGSGGNVTQACDTFCVALVAANCAPPMYATAAACETNECGPGACQSAACNTALANFFACKAKDSADICAGSGAPSPGSACVAEFNATSACNC